MDLKWLYRDRKSFIDLLPRLENLPNHVYESRFMDKLLEMHWPRIQSELESWQFYPYLIYCFLQVIYLKKALQPHEEGDEPNFWLMLIFALFTGIFLLMQCEAECR